MIQSRMENAIGFSCGRRSLVLGDQNASCRSDDSEIVNGASCVVRSSESQHVSE